MTAMCWLKLLISTGESIWPTIYPSRLHGNLAWIGSDWKLSGAQNPVKSAEGNVCIKARNLCNRQLLWATIRSKVAAHQASGFSAFSTSNYLGDHTFRKPSDIWLPINLLCQRISIFYLLHYLLYHDVREHGSKFYAGFISAFKLSGCCKIMSYLPTSKWPHADLMQ